MDQSIEIDQPQSVATSVADPVDLYFAFLVGALQAPSYHMCPNSKFRLERDEWS